MLKRSMNAGSNTANRDRANSGDNVQPKTELKTMECFTHVKACSLRQHGQERCNEESKVSITSSSYIRKVNNFVMSSTDTVHLLSCL